MTELLYAHGMLFDVTTERDGRFWLVRIPEIDGVTQARTREEVPEMARDYIAITLTIPASSFEILVDLWRAEPLPNGADTVLDHLARSAAGYGNRLQWREKEKFKADLMNCRARWANVSAEHVRARALNAGMRAEDADLIADLVRKRSEGRRLVPKTTYRDFRFGFG